jgi:threonylcarbamoyladenosine tRNA methylthiotransferase MtaB
MQTRRATVSFKTVGCRLNQAETATIRASFEEAGYKTVPFGEPCDICVIHGCVVTSKAEEDSLRLARSIKRRHPNAFVVLAGCAAEFLKNGEHTIPEQIDHLAGQHEKFQLPDILSPQFLASERRMRNIAPRLMPAFSTKRAIVKIQDGCDCRCAYCIVPFVRGGSRSRPAGEIIDEITRLTLNGFTEIVITGANIGYYADDVCTLPQLLEKIEAIDSLQRFRISSVEIADTEEIRRRGEDPPPPKGYGGLAASPYLSHQSLTGRVRASLLRRNFDIPIIHEIIDFMASSKKMCRFLHLPLQSGSDRILKAMGRPYTAEQYSAIVEYACKKIGLLGLGTDIIVGFPGETEDDFHATEQVIRQLPFSNLHVFSYSPRPGTAAYSMSDQVSGQDKEKRARALINLGHRKRLVFAKQFIGRPASLLVEKLKPDNWAEGWTGEYLWARVRAEHLKLRQIVKFTCERVEDDTLVGTLIQKSRLRERKHNPRKKASRSSCCSRSP